MDSLTTCQILLCTYANFGKLHWFQERLSGSTSQYQSEKKIMHCVHLSNPSIMFVFWVPLSVQIACPKPNFAQVSV